MNRASLFWEISVTESGRDDALIAQELAAGHPIICSVTQGEFTDAGHFIVLTGMNGEMVTVKDPFSIENTEKPWDLCGYCRSDCRNLDLFKIGSC